MSGNGGTGTEIGTDDPDVELYDETREYTAAELCRACRLPQERLVDYVAHGVVTEVGPDGRFTHVELRRLVRAVRVRRELEVELPNLALVVDLLERLAGQRRELERLRRELGRPADRGQG